MLQQTQTDRVVPKYEAFLAAFPTLAALAAADSVTVLQYWQGLGYNRRGLNLQRAAQEIMSRFSGQVPTAEQDLRSLPGIGPYTAAAIRAFAFNMPAVVIETNIRRAYLHHFFADQEGVPDKELLPVIDRTMDRKNPRQWYQALMDYGAYLGRTLPNPNRRSKHYSKQSKFEGSRRQLRGEIVRQSVAGKVDANAIVEKYGADPGVIRDILTELRAEGFPV